MGDSVIRSGTNGYAGGLSALVSFFESRASAATNGIMLEGNKVGNVKSDVSSQGLTVN